VYPPFNFEKQKEAYEITLLSVSLCIPPLIFEKQKEACEITLLSLSLCVCVSPLIFEKKKQKQKGAYEITLLSVSLCVCVSPNFLINLIKGSLRDRLIFSFYMRFVSYQKKVGD
jgi:hypothetical protein